MLKLARRLAGILDSIGPEPACTEKLHVLTQPTCGIQPPPQHSSQKMRMQSGEYLSCQKSPQAKAVMCVIAPAGSPRHAGFPAAKLPRCTGSECMHIPCTGPGVDLEGDPGALHHLRSHVPAALRRRQHRQAGHPLRPLGHHLAAHKTCAQHAPVSGLPPALSTPQRGC